MQVNPTWNYYKAKVKDTLSSDEGKAIYRRRKFDVEPVFGHLKRDFGIRRTHLRGQQAVENDIGLALMTLNLTKLGQSISRLATNFINNLKSGLRFLNQSKIVVRILLLENQELIVNSQPLFVLKFLFNKIYVNFTSPLAIPIMKALYFRCCR